jgi:hypothetical protein
MKSKAENATLSAIQGNVESNDEMQCSAECNEMHETNAEYYDPRMKLKAKCKQKCGMQYRAERKARRNAMQSGMQSKA